MAVTKPVFLAGMARLWVSFPSRNLTDEERVVLVDTVWREVARTTWLDDVTWDQAVSACLRHYTWLPTVRQLLEACVDIDRERDRKAATEEVTAEHARNAVQMLHDAQHDALPSAYHRCIASGVWDRSMARQGWRNLHRNAVYEQARAAAFQDCPLETSMTVRKRLARSAGQYAIAGVPLRPPVTDADINAMLHRMAAVTVPTDGVWPLRGNLEDALGAVLDHDGEF